MEDYPSEYVTLARPLVVLLGTQYGPANTNLQKPLNNGAAIVCETPIISEHSRDSILRALSKYDASKVDESARTGAVQVNRSLQFRFKPSNRRYVFPSRKASPPPSQVVPGTTLANNMLHILHSPLSPHSPGSPTFPDGVMTSLWFSKYLEALPAVMISFFELSHEANNDTLNDNKLKTDINSVQAALNDRSYKGKHVVILVGDESLDGDDTLDTRLLNIRRAVKLDNKSTFFYLPPDLQADELGVFFDSTLQALRPFCTEFYRSLHKHARRKKDRSSLPSTPLSEDIQQRLLNSGWNARYSVKMGLFSEVRYEMDAAARSYGEALNYLLDPQGVFDQTSSWSPRFNEARQLADCVAVRRLRCLLADGHTVPAANFWSIYHERTREMVGRLGKGSNTYGWPCWEARWSKIMGQLIQGAPLVASDSNARRSLEALQDKHRSAFASADRRNRTPEQSNPWTTDMHHPGYWFALAATYQGIRAAMAAEIPEKDKVPPARSPASSVSRVHREYESYMCPEPNVEGNEVRHATEIAGLLQQAREEFIKRGHARFAVIMALAVAEQLVRYSRPEALSLMQKLRRDVVLADRDWLPLREILLHKVYDVAKAEDDGAALIEVTWELLHKRFATPSGFIGDLVHATEEANRGQQQEKSEGIVTISDASVVSFVDLGISFQTAEVAAGDRCRIQLALFSNARAASSPVAFDQLRIGFEGMTDVVIFREDSEMSTPDSTIVEIAVTEQAYGDGTEPSFRGSASLVLHPGQTRIYTLSLPMRDTGEVRAREAVLEITRPSLSLRFTKELTIASSPSKWYSPRPGVGLFGHHQHWDAGVVRVLPKEPNVVLRAPNLRAAYYTGERAVINVEIVNEESGAIDAQLEVSLSNAETALPGLRFLEDGETLRSAIPHHDKAVCRMLSPMDPMASRMIAIEAHIPTTLATELNLALELRYHGQADASSLTSKTSSTKLNILEPFRPSFTLEPLLHPASWQSYFDTEATGLQMRWQLRVGLTSQAQEDIVISQSSLDILNVGDGATCTLHETSFTKTTIAPSISSTHAHIIDISKQSLEDPRPTTLDASIKVLWRRDDSPPDTLTETVLPTPRLSLPSAEPRALATCQPASSSSFPSSADKVGPGQLNLSISLENPSMHYLSFSLTLEPDDDFILSGPTKKSVNLVPLSRENVDFSLLPTVEKGWIRPVVKVVDMHFNKVLSVHGAQGMSTDEQGRLRIWIG